MHIATNSSRINISEENSVKSIANLFAENLNHTAVFLLYGEVGVGKTTFVKHFINCLQSINKEQTTEVPSPTFNIVNEYGINNKIYQHYDLYRVQHKNELNNLGIFEQNRATKLIEWPELLKSVEFEILYKLKFEYDNDMNNRFLNISSNNSISFLDEF